MKSVVMPLSQCARSCALSPNSVLAVSGFDDGSLKVGLYIMRPQLNQSDKYF